MQIVINIPNEEYEDVKKVGGCYYDFGEAIFYGTPLPKGHGKIGDLDAVINNISASIDNMTNIGIAIDGEYLWAKLNDAIDNTPIIVEADNAESEE